MKASGCAGRLQVAPCWEAHLGRPAHVSPKRPMLSAPMFSALRRRVCTFRSSSHGP